jgi:hypothetical protein
MSDSPEMIGSVRQWVEKAEHDLINAEYTLTLEKIVRLIRSVLTPNSVLRNISRHS